MSDVTLPQYYRPTRHMTDDQTQTVNLLSNWFT